MNFMIILIYFPTGRRWSNPQRRWLVKPAAGCIIIYIGLCSCQIPPRKETKQPLFNANHCLWYNPQKCLVNLVRITLAFIFDIAVSNSDICCHPFSVDLQMMV